MPVDFYTADDQTSTKVLTLDLQDGVVVPTFGEPKLADYILRGHYGEMPGQRHGFTASDGEDFLRVLPLNFSGSRLFARMSGDGMAAECDCDDKPVSEDLADDIESAASETDTEPTEAEMESGEYDKGEFVLHGMRIAIETPKGAERTGADDNGNPWSVVMQSHYGEIVGTESADSDPIDVFIGPHPESEAVYIIDQINQETGEFDEHKVMLGWAGAENAVAGYLENYQDGWKLGPVNSMTVDEFRRWILRGDTAKPVEESPAIEHLLSTESWDESKHPRADNGRFISAGEISLAIKSDAKAADLFAKTTDPVERKKLQNAIGKKPKQPKPPAKRARRDMPQIAGVDKDDFYDSMRSQGIKVVARELPAGQIKSMQLDHNQDKVDAMAAKIRAGEPVGTSRSIVSSDGYMMDGNHRMLAQQAVDPDGLLPVSQVDLTADELVDKMKSYGRSFKVGTDEPTEQRTTSKVEARETMKRELGRIAAEYPVANKGGGDTQNRYRNRDKTYTVERQALHDTIVNNTIAGAKPSTDKTVFLSGGGSAAGKGTLLENGTIKRSANYIHVDADQVKAKLPEFEVIGAAFHMGAAAFVHEESSDIVERTMHEGYKIGADISFDGTGDSGIEKLTGKIEKMRANGYKVIANYVTTDTQAAVARAVDRGRRKGRFVDPDVIAGLHAGVSRVVPQAIERGLFDEFNLWDNNEDTPRLVAEATGTDLKIHDQGLWDRFTRKADE